MVTLGFGLSLVPPPPPQLTSPQIVTNTNLERAALVYLINSNTISGSAKLAKLDAAVAGKGSIVSSSWPWVSK